MGVEKAAGRIELVRGGRDPRAHPAAHRGPERMVEQARLVEVEDDHIEALAMTGDKKIVEVEVGMEESAARDGLERRARIGQHVAADVRIVVGADKFPERHAGGRAGDEKAAIGERRDPSHGGAERLDGGDAAAQGLGGDPEFDERAGIGAKVEIVEQMAHRAAAAASPDEQCGLVVEFESEAASAIAAAVRVAARSERIQKGGDPIGMTREILAHEQVITARGKADEIARQARGRAGRRAFSRLGALGGPVHFSGSASSTSMIGMSSLIG